MEFGQRSHNEPEHGVEVPLVGYRAMPVLPVAERSECGERGNAIGINEALTERSYEVFAQRVDESRRIVDLHDPAAVRLRP